MYGANDLILLHGCCYLQGSQEVHSTVQDHPDVLQKKIMV